MTQQPIAGLFPVLIQSRFGTRGNYELVVSNHGGLAHFWRNNDDAPGYPWSLPTVFGTNAGPPALLSPTMIESTFGDPGNLEVICLGGAQVPAKEFYYFWRDCGPTFTWNGPSSLSITPPQGVMGDPVLIQSRFGDRGNFEIVTPVFGGGLAHLWRDNDDPARPWSRPTLFGDDLTIEGLTFIQSTFGDPGNLEVIVNAVSGAGGPNQLYHFWRDSGPTFTWNGPYPLPITPPAGGALGNPVLIQSRFGQRGNFELVSAAQDGGLAHYWRNNDDPAQPWSEPTLFGGGLGEVNGVTMVQSTFGDPGNLEVICAAGPGELHYCWRDSGPTFTWNGPYPLLSTT